MVTVDVANSNSTYAVTTFMLISFSACVIYIVNFWWIFMLVSPDFRNHTMEPGVS